MLRSAGAQLHSRSWLFSAGLRLELAVLGEGVSREAGALAVLLDLDPDAVGGGATVGMAQNGVLGEHLVVELGDQEVLSIPIVTPNLSQLDGLHRHGVTPQFRLAAGQAGVNWRRSYEGAVPVTLGAVKWLPQ